MRSAIARALFGLPLIAFLTTGLHASEGFFAVGEARQIPQKVRDRISNQVGMLLLNKPLKVGTEQVREWREGYCGNPAARLWSAQLCEKLTAKSCDTGCEIKVPRRYCSGFVINGYFITAGHCGSTALEDASFDPHARIEVTKGKVKDFQLTPTKMTRHEFPYDISIFKISGFIDAGYRLQLRTTEPKNGEKVFSWGFPILSLKYRPQKAEHYPRAYSEPRIATGQIVNANANRASYCHFTNDVEHAKPEAWILENTCPTAKTDATREERNPLLTDTDMIYGMSGAPLFDASGAVLGLGSTVLNSAPGTYVSTKLSVFVKAASIRDLLAKMAP